MTPYKKEVIQPVEMELFMEENRQSEREFLSEYDLDVNLLRLWIKG